MCVRAVSTSYNITLNAQASLARFSREDQTNITREAIAKVRDAALGPLEQGGRQVSRGVQAFKFGNVQVVSTEQLPSVVVHLTDTTGMYGMQPAKLQGCMTQHASSSE